jgi:hypothetical protein
MSSLFASEDVLEVPRRCELLVAGRTPDKRRQEPKLFPVQETDKEFDFSRLRFDNGDIGTIVEAQCLITGS